MVQPENSNERLAWKKPLPLVALLLAITIPAADAQELLTPPDNGDETTNAAKIQPVQPSATVQPNIRVERAKKQERQPRLSQTQPLSSVTSQLRRNEQDAFASPGIRSGSFILRPSIETGLLATSNATSSPGGGDAIVSQSTMRTNVVSDWERDSFELNTYSTFEKSISGEDLKQTEAQIEATFIHELANDYRLRVFSSYGVGPEAFDSPVEITGAVDQPIQQTLTGRAEILKDAGKLRLAIGGDVDREWYGGAKLQDGSVISQADRDNTLATAKLRVGYSFSPSLTPFVEVRAGRRKYDEALDSAGYDRSAGHQEALAGIAFDRGEKFWGELALGYVREKPDDDRLDAIEGLNASADINWSPFRGTNVNLLGTTQVEGTTTPGWSGSILYSGLLTVERQMRSDLTGSIAGGIGYRDYQGNGDYDMIYTAEASATWWMNRHFGLTGRARHENVNSTIDGRDATTNSIYLGIKAQQ
ncbi:MAG: outer membrane beta-barrel protein [Mesorhizobium sp.]